MHCNGYSMTLCHPHCSYELLLSSYHGGGTYVHTYHQQSAVVKALSTKRCRQSAAAEKVGSSASMYVYK